MMLQLRAAPSSIARDAELYAMLYTQGSPDSWRLGWGGTERGGGRDGGRRRTKSGRGREGCCARVARPVPRAIEPSWMSSEARISADWFGLGVIRDVISEVTPHAPAVRPCIAVTSLRSCNVHPPPPRC